MSSKQKILVVDDDKQIVTLLRSYLEAANYEIIVAYDGETALHALRRERPDLLLLDLMLPERDGWELTQLIRNDQQLRGMPIIHVTARIEDVDKILGLELGADDYVIKPFNPREVVARVRSLLRRSQDLNHAEPSPVLTCGGLKLDMEKHTLRRDGDLINLTPTEFKLLQVMMQHIDRVYTRSELVEHAFGYESDSFDRTLDNHISNLRKKIEYDPQHPVYLHTIYGVGYKLTEQ